jgi:2-polyprenyl-6-methoxyphenol hydroxylase-like FAD-dependent oxidoreductase
MTTMSNHIGDRAVVLGGSMAGLLTAAVLAEAYEEVMVIDRDQLTGVMKPRRGVPQGRHAHGVLARGRLAFDELFPGFTERLTAAGVPMGDLSGQVRWYFNGRRLRPSRTGLTLLGPARPMLEGHVRDLVSALPNVVFVEESDIIAPVTSRDGGRVGGVRIQHRSEGSTEMTVEADLVVDATGRASRTPAWLEAAGYPRVEEERMKIGLTYTSRQYRLRSDPFHGDLSINPVATPAHPRGAFLHTLGGDRCLLSLTGMLGDQAPTDPDGFLAYARSLPVPDVFDAIRDAEPLTDPVSFRFPASQRRRYERLSRFPERFLVIGDAMCSFNPVYGQGMTVAALEALALRRHVRRGTPPQAREFFKDIAKIIDAPWEVAAGGDLAFPGVEGRRTMKSRLGNAYMARLHAAATHDAGITEAFMRVAGLVDPPQALMRPALALRVLRTARQPLPPGQASTSSRDQEGDSTARPAA